MIWLTAQEEARFRSKIVVAGPDECWNWNGCTCGGRDLGWYGYFARGRAQVREQGGPRMMYAHRVMFCLARGYPLDYLTEEQAVMHTCDNHLCCNPHHGELGTQLLNVQDMIAKKRNARGGKISRKLCEDRVRSIKTRLLAGDRQADLAREFNVAPSAIAYIASGRNWGWVQASQEIPV